MTLYIVPRTIKQANHFVEHIHRHNKPVTGARLAYGAADENGILRGVVLIGRPVSRYLDDGLTLEINRVCTDGYKNCGSFLMASAWNAAKAIGYRRLITYTLPEEGGASLRAVGWRSELREIGHQWNCQSRPRAEQEIYLSDKYRWEVTIDTALPFDKVTVPSIKVSGEQLLLETALPPGQQQQGQPPQSPFIGGNQQ